MLTIKPNVRKKIWNENCVRMNAEHGHENKNENKRVTMKRMKSAFESWEMKMIVANNQKFENRIE